MTARRKIICPSCGTNTLVTGGRMRAHHVPPECADKAWTSAPDEHEEVMIDVRRRCLSSGALVVFPARRGGRGG